MTSLTQKLGKLSLGLMLKELLVLMAFLFSQQFQDLIKDGLMELFNEWRKDRLDLFRLNFSLLAPIPKEPDATSVLNYRLIALTNCDSKFFLQVCYH